MKRLSLLFLLAASAFGQFSNIQTDGSGNVIGPNPIHFDFVTVTGIGGGGSPGGLDTQFQFNQAGVFGGTANLVLSAGQIFADSNAFVIQDTVAGTQLQFNLANVITSAALLIPASSSQPVAVNPDAGAANNFLTGITGLGQITKAQPAFSNLSGSATNAQLPATISGKTLTDTNLYTVKDGGNFIIKNESDTTKQVQFDLSNAQPFATQVITVPNASNSVTVAPDSGAANNYLTGIDPVGLITKARPTIGNLTNLSAVSKLVGSGSAAATVTELTLGTNLSMSGTTLNAAGGSLTVGTTAIASGTGTRLLYETSGNLLGEVSNATSDGTTLTLTSPKVITNIKDTAGLAWLGVTATASAVNNLNISNAATTGSPTISAEGTDASVNITLTPKGSGGWTRFSSNNGGGAMPSSGTGLALGWNQSSGSGEIDYVNTFSTTSGTTDAHRFLLSNNTTVAAVTYNGGVLAGNIVPAGSAAGFYTLSSGAVSWNNDVTIFRDAVGGLAVTNGTAGQWGYLKTGIRDGGTATVVDGLFVGHQSTGTPAANFGSGIMFNANDSTTVDVNAGEIQALWTTATHTSETADFVFRTKSGGTMGTRGTIKSSGVYDSPVGYRINGAAATGKIQIGDGTNFIASTPTYPNAASTALKWVRSDGTNFITSTSTLSDTPSTSGKIPQSDGTNWITSTATWPTTNGYGDVPMGDGTNWVASPIGKAIITSTVDQTGTAEQAHVIFTVPANSARIGTTYLIKAWGNIDNGTTAITFTPRIRWGGTGGVQMLATPTVVGTTTAQTNKTWAAEAIFTVRTTGASGTATCSLAVENHTASTTGVFARDQSDSTATAVTIDTTAGKDLDLTWTLSATTGTPHLRTIGGYIEIIK